MNVRPQKTRIAFLTDCLADLSGGAEKQIFELAKSLDKDRYDITIASLECEGQAPRGLIESINCRLTVFPVKRIYGLSGIIEGFRFIRFLKRHRTDILMTYHFSSDIWGTVMARIAGVGVIISNRRDMGFWRSQRHIQAYKIINRYVTKIIVNAQAIKTLFIQEEGIEEEKIQVIHNGIDLCVAGHRSPNPSLKNDLGINKGDVVIVHVANIKPVKGHEYLIKAFAEIVARHSNVKLLLIGEDKLNGQMNALAEELDIKKHVLFLGKKDNVVPYLNLADICVLPSLSEGMSNAIMEYMASCKPVVATRVGGNTELVDDGVTGLLVEKEDPEGFKAALITLIEDKKKRITMGEKGRQKIMSEFSARKMVDNYQHLFRSFVSGKKKVLHLISSSGLFGAENIVLTLGQGINDRDNCSIVGAFQNSHNGEADIIQRAKELGIGTFILKCGGRFDAGAIFRLKTYLNKNKIDVLHTHNYKSDIIGALAARLAGVPAVATAHGFTDMTRSVAVYERLDRWVLKTFFGKVVTVTDKVLPGFPEGKKRVIPNGIDMARFSRDGQRGAALRKKLNVKEDDVFIGTVGRLSREKNQKMLLEAVYPIMRDNEQIKVIIVGDGPKRGELEQFCEARHLGDRIIFPGVMHDVASVYSAIDIFVLSSFTEGVPLTVLEAMASGLPVVATRVGGIPGIIDDDETGLLVDSRDTAALRAKIEGLIKDQNKRRQLAESASKSVEANYSLERMCDAYRRVYEEVLG